VCYVDSTIALPLIAAAAEGPLTVLTADRR
jgi:hypothetical protein